MFNASETRRLRAFLQEYTHDLKMGLPRRFIEYIRKDSQDLNDQIEQLMRLCSHVLDDGRSAAIDGFCSGCGLRRKVQAA